MTRARSQREAGAPLAAGRAARALPRAGSEGRLEREGGGGAAARCACLLTAGAAGGTAGWRGRAAVPRRTWRHMYRSRSTASSTSTCAGALAFSNSRVFYNLAALPPRHGLGTGC